MGFALVAGAPLQAEDAKKPEILVFAAASLTNVLGELSPAFEKKSGVTVKLSFAASSVLARQIEAGGSGRCVHLGRPGVDGLPADSRIARSKSLAAQPRRQPPGPDRAGRQQGRTEDRGPDFRWSLRSATAAWPPAIPTRCPWADMPARRSPRSASGRRSEPAGPRRKRPQRDDVRVTRRSTARHRLHHRRAGGSEGARGRHLSRQHARTHHLSRRGDERCGETARPPIVEISWRRRTRARPGRNLDSSSSTK